MNFLPNVNCVSTVISPTTMSDHHHGHSQLVDSSSSTTPNKSNITQAEMGTEGNVPLDIAGPSRSEMANSEDSVSRKLEASLRFVLPVFGYGSWPVLAHFSAVLQLSQVTSEYTSNVLVNFRQNTLIFYMILHFYALIELQNTHR